MTLYVKTRGYHMVSGQAPDAQGRQGGHMTINPGSVVAMEEDMAKEFVKRGLGIFHPGPEFNAPHQVNGQKLDLDGPTESLAIPAAVERQDLGKKLARAERATAPVQRGAI